MNTNRRSLIKLGMSLPALPLITALAGMGMTTVVSAAGFNANAYKAKTVNEALAALGAGDVVESANISISAADIAENGAVVPVGVTTDIAGAESIAILVDKNASVLAADFTVVPTSEAFVSTRVKMGQTSNVVAAVRANGKWHVAKKEIKVTLGGCGG